MAGCLTQPDIISDMEITLWPVYELVDFWETFVLVTWIRLMSYDIW